MTVVCWVETGGAGGDDRPGRTVAIAQALVDRGVRVRWVTTDAVAPTEDPLCVLRNQARAADAIVIDVAQPLSRFEVETLRRRWPVLVVDHRGDGAARVVERFLAVVDGGEALHVGY